MITLNINSTCVLILIIILSVVVTKSRNEFSNGKLSSGQGYGDHKYHHIIVNPSNEDTSQDRTSTSLPSSSLSFPPFFPSTSLPPSFKFSSSSPFYITSSSSSFGGSLSSPSSSFNSSSSSPSFGTSFSSSFGGSLGTYPTPPPPGSALMSGAPAVVGLLGGFLLEDDPVFGIPKFQWFTSSRGNGCYRLVRARTRIAQQYVRAVLRTPDRAECEYQCAQAAHFTCRGFNFRFNTEGEGGQAGQAGQAPHGPQNCELSLQDTHGADLDDTRTFHVHKDFDFYERIKFGRDCQGRPLLENQVEDTSNTTRANRYGVSDWDLRYSWPLTPPHTTSSPTSPATEDPTHVLKNQWPLDPPQFVTSPSIKSRDEDRFFSDNNNNRDGDFYPWNTEDNEINDRNHRIFASRPVRHDGTSNILIGKEEENATPTGISLPSVRITVGENNGNTTPTLGNTIPSGTHTTNTSPFDNDVTNASPFDNDVTNASPFDNNVTNASQSDDINNNVGNTTPKRTNSNILTTRKPAPRNTRLTRNYPTMTRNPIGGPSETLHPHSVRGPHFTTRGRPNNARGRPHFNTRGRPNNARRTAAMQSNTRRPNQSGMDYADPRARIKFHRVSINRNNDRRTNENFRLGFVSQDPNNININTNRTINGNGNYTLINVNDPERNNSKYNVHVFHRVTNDVNRYNINNFKFIDNKFHDNKFNDDIITGRRHIMLTSQQASTIKASTIKNKYSNNLFDTNRFSANDDEITHNTFDGNQFNGNAFKGNKFEVNSNNKFAGNKFNGNRFTSDNENHFTGNRFTGNWFGGRPDDRYQPLTSVDFNLEGDDKRYMWVASSSFSSNNQPHRPNNNQNNNVVNSGFTGASQGLFTTNTNTNTNHFEPSNYDEILNMVSRATSHPTSTSINHNAWPGDDFNAFVSTGAHSNSGSLSSFGSNIGSTAGLTSIHKPGGSSTFSAISNTYGHDDDDIVGITSSMYGTINDYGTGGVYGNNNQQYFRKIPSFIKRNTESNRMEHDFKLETRKDPILQPIAAFPPVNYGFPSNNQKPTDIIYNVHPILVLNNENQNKPVGNIYLPPGGHTNNNNNNNNFDNTQAYVNTIHSNVNVDIKNPNPFRPGQGVATNSFISSSLNDQGFFGNNNNNNNNNNNHGSFGNNFNNNNHGINDERRPGCFTLAARRRKLLPGDVRRALRVSDLKECQRRCQRSNDFVCRALAFRHRGGAWQRDNCYLSDRGGHGDREPTRPHFAPDDRFHVYARKHRSNCSGYQDNSLLQSKQGSETVTGIQCYRSDCHEDAIAGYWYCQTNSAGAWDYCCRPDQTCGKSEGYNFNWCYVGSVDRSQWRPCGEGFEHSFLFEEGAAITDTNSLKDLHGRPLEQKELLFGRQHLLERGSNLTEVNTFPNIRQKPLSAATSFWGRSGREYIDRFGQLPNEEVGQKNGTVGQGTVGQGTVGQGTVGLDGGNNSDTNNSDTNNDGGNNSDTNNELATTVTTTTTGVATKVD